MPDMAMPVAQIDPPPPRPVPAFVDFRASAEPAVQRNPALTTLFTLFLVLLGFFIMLNAMSNAERGRAAAVSGGLAAALGTRVAGVPDSPRADPFRVEVERLARDRTLPLREPAALPAGISAGFAATEDDMFAVGRATLTRAGEEVLRFVVSALIGTAAGAGHGVEILVPASRGTLALERSGQVARRLVEFGAPVGAISVGIQPGTVRAVAVSFAPVRQ